MDSPLLQPVPTPKRMIVPGTHNAHGSYFTVIEVPSLTLKRGIQAYIGPESNKTSFMTAAALRSYSALYLELADALEGK